VPRVPAHLQCPLPSPVASPAASPSKSAMQPNAPWRRSLMPTHGGHQNSAQQRHRAAPTRQVLPVAGDDVAAPLLVSVSPNCIAETVHDEGIPPFRWQPTGVSHGARPFVQSHPLPGGAYLAKISTFATPGRGPRLQQRDHPGHTALVCMRTAPDRPDSPPAVTAGPTCHHGLLRVWQ